MSKSTRMGRPMLWITSPKLTPYTRLPLSPLSSPSGALMGPPWDAPPYARGMLMGRHGESPQVEHGSGEGPGQLGCI